MSAKVLVLGGYGNFGKRVTMALVKADIEVIIAGRSYDKAAAFAKTTTGVEIATFDVERSLQQYLQALKPAVVIDTCGPFQNRDYTVARTCIENKVHYIDFADGRDYVTNFQELDQLAKKYGVLAVSGASSVPGLSSAIIENFQDKFSEINSLKYGISPGQKSERGLATTRGILTYVGKLIKSAAGSSTQIYGWQNIYKHEFPELGMRWMANCDVPDLDLFPPRYNIKSIQFSAGIESTALHLGLWLCSWLIRMGIPLNLAQHSEFLLKASHWFDWMGTDVGGMFMNLKGLDKTGKKSELTWYIIARSGDGPQIPCIPAIILTKKLLDKTISKTGALPCVGLVTLQEYLDELKDFNIETFEKWT